MKNTTTQDPIIESEDLRLDLDYGIDYGSYGYDSDTKQYFWGSKAGKVTNMTKEEYDRWYKNRPLNNVALPRQGKDIILTTYRGTNKTSITWKWDGKKFHL